MIEKDEQLVIFAAFALMGLVARGESPTLAGQQMWQYAQQALNQKDPQDGK